MHLQLEYILFLSLFFLIIHQKDWKIVIFFGVIIHRSSRPVTRNFDVFFDVHMNKLLNKQSICRWFETSWRSVWRHSSV